MEKRKIVGFGRSSLIVSLPREWARENKIEKGDSVFIENNGDKLIVRNKMPSDSKPEKQAVIKTTKDQDIESVKRWMCVKYINNHNVIEVNGPAVKKFSNEIKNYLRELMVFEILEETDDIIIAKDYLNLNTLDAKTIFTRMYSIVLTMFDKITSEVTAKIYENIEDNEIKLNAYYFLIQRFNRFHLNNPDSKENILEVYDYWQLALYLEDCGDNIEKIAEEMLKENLPQCKEIFDLIKSYKDYFVHIHKVFFDKDNKKLTLASEYKKDILTKIQAVQNIKKKLNLELFNLFAKNIHSASRVMLNFVE